LYDTAKDVLLGHGLIILQQQEQQQQQPATGAGRRRPSPAQGDTARNLSIVLHALAKMQLPPPPAWKAAFMAAWMGQVQEAGAQALSMALWAFAR
jgi:hypothetical protein